MSDFPGNRSAIPHDDKSKLQEWRSVDNRQFVLKQSDLPRLLSLVVDQRLGQFILVLELLANAGYKNKHLVPRLPVEIV